MWWDLIGKVGIYLVSLLKKVLYWMNTIVLSSCATCLFVSLFWMGSMCIVSVFFSKLYFECVCIVELYACMYAYLFWVSVWVWMIAHLVYQLFVYRLWLQYRNHTTFNSRCLIVYLSIIWVMQNYAGCLKLMGTMTLVLILILVSL